MKAQALVARNLRRLRVRRELSQEALAVDASIDRTYVSRLERGLENPTVAVLERMAAALDAGIEEFFVRPKPGEAVTEPLRRGRKRKLSRKAAR
jgi:transcriptional regulator with XRE-family HTH domain